MKNTVFRLVPALLLTGLLGIWLRANPADERPRTPVLLELFTSEGCSSCPPADRLLKSLDETQPYPAAELIVLSEHVDYWNGDGWSDPFSSHILTQRQQAYADHLGVEDVYTPQLVVDGVRQMVGSNAAAVRDAVTAETRSGKLPLAISQLARDGDRLKFHLTLPDPSGASSPAAIYVALAVNEARSNVAAGENRGRSLVHVAVVRLLVKVGMAKPGGPFSKNIVLSGADRTYGLQTRVIVFLQDLKTSRILGAAQSKL